MSASAVYADAQKTNECEASDILRNVSGNRWECMDGVTTPQPVGGW